MADPAFRDLGKLLLVAGLLLAAAGAILMLGFKVPWLGRLPGDLVLRRGSLTVFVPIVTSIVLSVLLTVLLSLLLRR